MRGAADATAGNMNAVAVATKELSDSSREIAAQVVDSARLTGEATDNTDGARERVSTLEKATKNISSIVDLINSIAAQTKLLALNATIEAARAGEARLCCRRLRGQIPGATDRERYPGCQPAYRQRTDSNPIFGPGHHRNRFKNIRNKRDLLGCLCRR